MAQGRIDNMRRDDLTCDDESKSDANNPQIPEAPEIHLVEQHSGIDEPTQLIVGKRHNPNIHEDLEEPKAVWPALHQY